MVPYIDMTSYDQGGCLHDLFTKQATETPNKIAVVTADGKKVKNLFDHFTKVHMRFFIYNFRFPILS